MITRFERQCRILLTRRRQMPEISDASTLETYARLLRRSWLNPSEKQWQRELLDFEREHEKELDPLWTKWQAA